MPQNTAVYSDRNFLKVHISSHLNLLHAHMLNIPPYAGVQKLLVVQFCLKYCVSLTGKGRASPLWRRWNRCL